MPDIPSMADSPALVRLGLRLNYLSIAYNVLEAAVALLAGLFAGSVALIGFGLDSAIEVTASGAAQWRLRAELDAVRRQRVEHTAARIIAWCFLALAVYVSYDSIASLMQRDRP